MTDTQLEISEISEAVREKRGWFIALGIILILVGTAAMILPHIATLSTTIFIGWFLIIGGIVQAIHAFWVKDWGGFFWQLILGLLEAVAGLALLVFPIAGIIGITIYLAAMFTIEGIIRAVLAFQLKPEAGWIWVLIGSGLLGVVAPGAWGTAALNLFLVMAAVYFLQGLAIVQNLFEVRSFPRMFRVAAYILLFVQLPVMMLVAGVGAFDLWFDFRSRWVPPDDDAGTPED